MYKIFEKKIEKIMKPGEQRGRKWQRQEKYLYMNKKG